MTRPLSSQEGPRRPQVSPEHPPHRRTGDWPILTAVSGRAIARTGELWGRIVKRRAGRWLLWALALVLAYPLALWAVTRNWG